jgi:serine/threonine protein kinase
MHLQRQEDNRLAVDIARKFAARIVLALEHLHAKGVFGVDLRPSNILMDAQGNVYLQTF